MSVAAGWYADPEHPGRSRWWDGEQWAPPSPVPQGSPPGPLPPASDGVSGPSLHGSYGVGFRGAPIPPPPSFSGATPSFQGATGVKPPSYFVWAVLSTLLCCLPLGVASIVFAARVDGQWASGDHAGAFESSEKAKKFALASAGVALVIGVLSFMLSFQAAPA